ncbi:hypothetical protein [Occallatibacter savannae]|uniref:hypothetical protein n=1 Tax=Occallatibacter savannae TaxID=1002691 RepID=UPI000D69D897|nr:hypothetical protein [Occallatibacter savannae]
MDRGRRRQDQRTRTKTAEKRALLDRAKHEAGHAVFALMIDVEFRDVTIVPYLPIYPMHMIGSEAPVIRTALGGLRHNIGTVNYANDWDWACLSMAGLAGERIDWKSSGTFTGRDLFGGSYDDWYTAREEVRKFSTPGAVDKWINRVLADAWDRLLLEKAWHTRLVNLLLKKGTVEYGEVADLCSPKWAA